MTNDSLSRTAVILVNYFGAKDTLACVESLLASKSRVSIVVVDNSPNDSTLTETLNSYPDITILRPSENLGFGSGNNLGIDWVFKNLECEFIFVFNNDATVLPDAVPLLENAMDVHEEVGIAAPRIVLAEHPERLWYGGGDTDWSRGGARVYGFMGDAESSAALTESYVGFASGCAMFMRREVLILTGGFDSRFFMYEEDMELSIRVLKSGWKILYVPDALAYHRGQGSLRDENQPFTGKWDIRNENFSFHAYHMVRNSIVNAMTHARGKDAFVFVLFYPIFLVTKLLPHIARLRFRSIVPVAKGIRDGIRAGNQDNERSERARPEARR